MSDVRKLEEARERRTAELVRALPTPRPDPAFRARLLQEFLAGSLPAPAAAAAPLAPARPWWDSMLVPAAAGLLVLAGLLVNQGPGWEVLETQGEGTALVNGRALPLGDRAALAHALQGGARLRLPEGVSLTIAAPGRLAVEVTPGTEARLGAPPARWLGRIASAEVESGELRITTGERFPGSHLMVKTPEANVVVTGTTLAVIREPRGTCVCVMEGRVHVGVQGQPMVEIPAGRRRYFYRDGRPPAQDEMLPTERIKLGEMMSRRPAGARAPLGGR
jgi:ferric-dicitrate binding protein FerR (iron transport regulator)